MSENVNFQQEPGRKGRKKVTIVKNGEEIAKAIVGPDKRNPNNEYLQELNVDEKHQRQGLGKRLLQAIFSRAQQEAKSVSLEVRADNEAAVGLYRSQGLEVQEEFFDKKGRKYYKMKK